MTIRQLTVPNRFSHCEDAMAFHVVDDSIVIAVVADGMGGLDCGHVVSSLASDSILEYLKNNLDTTNPPQSIIDAFEFADNSIREKSLLLKSRMGASVAAVLIIANHAYVCHQGNVRVYLRSDEKNVLLTEDHVMEIGYGHRRLTRCLKGDGLREDLKVTDHILPNGCIISLCTDGFYSAMSEDWSILETEQISFKLGSPEDDCSLMEIRM